MRNRKAKDKPAWRYRWRANQREAKSRKRLDLGESELSQELRWLAAQRLAVNGPANLALDLPEGKA